MTGVYEKVKEMIRTVALQKELIRLYSLYVAVLELKLLNRKEVK